MAKRQQDNRWRRLKDLVRKHGTPLVAVSRSALLGQLAPLFLARFGGALGRGKPFYAIKANSHPDILKTMVAGGAGFDAASIPEMQAALSAGAKPRDIIFANTIKPAGIKTSF